MKISFSNFLPAIDRSIPVLTCEHCGYQFIIMNRERPPRDWSYLADPDFCPRCGYGHKTDYLGLPLKEGEE